MTEPPGAAIMRMITGGWVAQAIYVAARLGIADVLAADGPRSPHELAERVDADPDALHRVLRALAGIGVFTEREDGAFALTDIAECLRSDVPGSQRAFAVMMGNPEVWQSWGHILHTVRTGEPSFDHLYGMPVFDYYATNAEAAAVGAAGLSSRSVVENDAIVAAYDFSTAGTIMDVGGGEGSLLRTVLRAHPGAHGRLFDMPHVVELARIAADGMPEVARLEFAPGNFFEEIPEGSSVILLKKVIHDWDDTRSAAIFRNCRAALAAGDRLLLVENVIPPGNAPAFAKWLDLLMMVYAGGRERTIDQFDALLTGAGFRIDGVIPTAGGISIIDAVAV